MLIRRVAVTAAIVVGAQVPATVGVSSIDTLLRSHFRFTPAQVAEVQRGRAISVSMPGSIYREIVAAGAVRVDAPSQKLLDLVRDIRRLESGPGFVKTVPISDPPRAEDFAALILPAQDVTGLRRCKIGDCDFKLGERAFEQLLKINRQARDADAQVQQFARRMALESVEAYKKHGTAWLPVTLDELPPRQVASEFDQMVAGTPWLAAATPGLIDYLVRYPTAPRPPGLEEYFYWSFVEFGLKIVLRINHLVVYPVPGDGPVRWAVANRQIYASHYFQNALEVRVLVEDPAHNGQAHYLMVLNVARPDGLTGLFGGLVRFKVRSGSRDALRKTLGVIKQRCETSR
jgi:hypothetical protein